MRRSVVGSSNCHVDILSGRHHQSQEKRTCQLRGRSPFRVSLLVGFKRDVIGSNVVSCS